jgi:ABC-2 type transport system ATP-binding protein
VLVIEVHELTKRYGDVVAVDGMSFTVRPGVVTGFLGPNGAGKSTTMRMILGLDRPTSGTATVNGRRYAEARAPLAEIGALLDVRAVDKGRSARNHLLALGATIGVGAARVDHLLELVGLGDVARRNAGGFSLGMGQRLGIATALLGDPQVLMLDEPVNGLDPDGIQWIRALLRDLAAEGRTVFVSSHLMSEMEMTAEHLVVVGRGRVLADLSMADFIARSARAHVDVVTPDAARLRDALVARGIAATWDGADRLAVTGVPAAEVGRVAAAARVELHGLAGVAPSLEEAFMDLTRDEVAYRGTSEHAAARPAGTAAQAGTTRPAATDDPTPTTDARLTQRSAA